MDTYQEFQRGYRKSDPTSISVLPVDTGDLSLLQEAISRWRLFLVGLFPPPRTRDLREERLDKLSMEDTERFLDVKIQISRCLGSARETILEQEFESLLNDIRRGTSHYVCRVLPDLCENSRSLLASAQRNELMKSPGDAGWVFVHELDDSLEYKDCLISQRKQLKSEMARQRSRVIHQFIRLDQMVRRSFRPSD